MKNLVSILLIVLAFTLNVNAQTRTFNTKVKLNKLVEAQDNDDVLTINAEGEVSSIKKSDLVPIVQTPNLYLENGEIGITGGNTVKLPVPVGVATKAGTITLPNTIANGVGFKDFTGSYSRYGDVVNFYIRFTPVYQSTTRKGFSINNALPYTAASPQVLNATLEGVVFNEQEPSRKLNFKAASFGSLIYCSVEDARNNPSFTYFDSDFNSVDYRNTYTWDTTSSINEDPVSVKISGTYITTDPF